MKSALRSFFVREQFNPSWYGVWLNPFFLARRELWRKLSDLSPKISGSILDVGCGSKPYQSIFKEARYVGLDIDSPISRARATADKLYDGARFPFENAEFENAICNQVLEHVFAPDYFLSEINRVLVPSGLLLLTVPFVWDEHEQPFDFARYSSFGLKNLLERNGFEVIEHHKLLADASVLFQLAIAYAWKVIPGHSFSRNLAVSFLVAFPLSTMGLIVKRLLPKNPDFFLDQLVLARKLGDTFDLPRQASSN